MNTIKIKGRKAIAMIELIFAIVIIGITLMSIPNLIHTASESGYTSMQQEAIAAASADMSLILAREWDENNTDSSVGSYILTTTNTNSTDLNRTNRTNMRSRTYFTSLGGTLSASTTLGIDGNDGGIMDDIDDLPISGSRSGHVEDGNQDLIDTIDINETAVIYITDGSVWNSGSNPVTYSPSFTPAVGGGSTNIKAITTILISGNPATPELQKTIKLKAFSCNIGSYKLERKVF